MRPHVKATLYLGIFVILHFLYDFTHWAFLAPFCGTNESVFQHMKMAFWAYLCASLIEFAGARKTNDKKRSFWYPALLSAVSVPWFAALVWYLMPALLGKAAPLVIETTWAILVTYASGIFAGTVEKAIAKNHFDLSLKVVAIFLSVVSAVLYVWFTYRPPWIGVFVNPALLWAHGARSCLPL